MAIGRALTGKGPPRITGTTFVVDGGIRLTLLSGSRAMTAKRKADEVDALMREAAEHVHATHRPVLYAFYLDALSRAKKGLAAEKEKTDLHEKLELVDGNRDFQSEALEVIQRVTGEPGRLSAEERARIYNLWGVILTDQGNFDEAFAKFDLAVEKARRWYHVRPGSLGLVVRTVSGTLEAG